MLYKNLLLWILSATAAAAVSAPAGEAVALEIDRDASSIVAHVKATGHRFDAVVTDYELDLRWDIEREAIISAKLTFDFADVETGRTRRDREMRDWLEYESFPVAEFALTTIEATDDGPVAVGRLTLHGTERELEFPVSIERTGDDVRIRAETTIDHRDWELEEIRALLIMTVDPLLAVSIDVKATIP